MIAAYNWITLGVTIGLGLYFAICSADKTFAALFVDMSKEARIVGVSCRNRAILLVLPLRHLCHL